MRRRGGAGVLRGAVGVVRGAAAAAALMTLFAATAGTCGETVHAAGGGADGTFAEVFARSRLVAVAVVEAAPPADAELRLAIEASLKGDPSPRLAFAADTTSVPLAKGARVVLLAMDPTALDFRGTVALDVAADGTIDPDGLSGVPATVTALITAYGPPAASPTPPDASTAAPAATDGRTARSGVPWGVLVLLAGTVIAAAAAVAVGQRRRT